MYIQVLVREENPGIHYRFNPLLNRDLQTGFAWHYTSWSRCSALCAGGRNPMSIVLCEIKGQSDDTVNRHYTSLSYCFTFAAYRRVAAKTCSKLPE